MKEEHLWSGNFSSLLPFSPISLSQPIFSPSLSFSLCLIASFCINLRPRVTPAIPPSYFGNYLGYCFTEVKVGDVMDGDGVHVVAEAIGKAIDELMKHGVLREAEEWPRKLMALSSERPLSIAGSPKLGVCEIDFGWGKPVKVEVTTIKETGAMSMAEIGGGGGGIEFGLAFPKHEIDTFQTCFTFGLQLL